MADNQKVDSRQGKQMWTQGEVHENDPWGCGRTDKDITLEERKG